MQYSREPRSRSKATGNAIQGEVKELEFFAAVETGTAGTYVRGGWFECSASAETVCPLPQFPLSLVHGL